MRKLLCVLLSLTMVFSGIVWSFGEDTETVPENAPVADPYLLVIVEDANINKNNVIDFEEGVSRAVLSKFTTEMTSFNHCEFYYPSPAFYFAQEEE